MTDRWIPLQLDYLHRNMDSPYKVYADLEGIDPGQGARFHVATDFSAEREGAPVRHAHKLNMLADLIAGRADRDDILIFLDGDAFPVAPIGDLLEDRLSRYPLAAVRRDESLGDVQPHPSFCFTTVGFWQDLGGDWSRGPDWTWENALGRTVEDVGGKLLWQLSEQGVEWCPLLRTNAGALHPILFGVYEHRIYHHGAGFRPVFERTDRQLAGKVPPLPATLSLKPPSSPVGKLIWKVRAKIWYLTKKRRVVKRQERITRRNLELSEQVFSMILEDESFYIRL